MSTRFRTLAGFAAAALFMVGWASPGEAQQPTPGAPGGGAQALDGVAAVVGDSIVLRSEVDEEILRRQAQGQLQVPDDPGAQQQLRLQILEELIDQQLLLQEAAQDTLVDVSEDRVQQTVQDEMTRQMQAVGGEDQLREQLAEMGQTLSTHRNSLADQVRSALLMEQFMQVQLQQGRDAEVDEEELRRFFEEHREQFEQRPATIALQQVVLQPSASEEAREEALDRALELREMIVDGESFEEVARRHSDDPGSREEGGELGWYRQGDDELIEEVRDAAFSLREGQLSPVVESALGAHLVRVDRQRGGERLIRHILVATEVTEEDRERTAERAREIRQRIEDGESVAELAEEFSTVDLPTDQEFRMEELEFLPEGYVAEFLDPTTGELAVGPGDVLGPVSFEYQGQETHAVLRIDGLRDQGEWTFEEVRGQLEDYIGMEQFQDRLLRDLRERRYVENRMEGETGF